MLNLHDPTFVNLKATCSLLFHSFPVQKCVRFDEYSRLLARRGLQDRQLGKKVKDEYDDYENESSYIIRFSLSENKNYSIIYDSLNDSRYVHFIEFFKSISEQKYNDIYQPHRTSILIEDY